MSAFGNENKIRYAQKIPHSLFDFCNIYGKVKSRCYQNNFIILLCGIENNTT